MVDEGTTEGDQEGTIEGAVEVPTTTPEDLGLGDTVMGDVDPEK